MTREEAHRILDAVITVNECESNTVEIEAQFDLTTYGENDVTIYVYATRNPLEKCEIIEAIHAYEIDDHKADEIISRIMKYNKEATA